MLVAGALQLELLAAVEAILIHLPRATWTACQTLLSDSGHLDHDRVHPDTMRFSPLSSHATLNALDHQPGH
jgi:hypothetical protein